MTTTTAAPTATTASSSSTGPAARAPRVLALAGLAYPVLTIVGFAAFPKPPGGDVSAAHDPVWLASHTGAVISQSYVRGLAAVAFVLLTVTLAGAISAARSETVSGTLAGDSSTSDRSRALPRLAVAGGVTYSGLLLAAQAMMLAAALAARGSLGASPIQLLDSIDGALLSLASLPAILLFAGAGLGLLHAGAPRWLALFTLVGAPLALLDALSYDGGPLAAVGLVGLAYFLVWSLVVGVQLAAGRPAVSPAR